jgi:hypothetical protein
VCGTRLSPHHMCTPPAHCWTVPTLPLHTPLRTVPVVFELTHTLRTVLDVLKLTSILHMSLPWSQLGPAHPLCNVKNGRAGGRPDNARRRLGERATLTRPCSCQLLWSELLCPAVAGARVSLRSRMRCHPARRRTTPPAAC